MTTNPTPKSEVGKELRAPELRERTIVVLSRPDSEVAVTVWVKHITANFIFFRAGEINALFVGSIQADGTIADDTGRRVMMFEYLGEA